MTRERRLAALVPAALASTLVLACQTGKDAVPDDGTIEPIVHGTADSDQLSADFRIAEEDETEIGRGVSARLISTYGLSTDAALTEYVELIGNVVASSSDDPERRYHFAVLDTPAVNAFSTPGGFVFLTRGAVHAASSEAEIAALLGREIAHITLGHGIAAVKAGIARKGIGGVARSEGRFRLDEETMGPVVDAASDAVLRRRDRADEIESDALGAACAAAAGYNLNGLRRFLLRLEELSERKDASVEHLLATHPSPADRIEELDAALAERGLRADDARPWLEERFRERVTKG